MRLSVNDGQGRMGERCVEHEVMVNFKGRGERYNNEGGSSGLGEDFCRLSMCY